MQCHCLGFRVDGVKYFTPNNHHLSLFLVHHVHHIGIEPPPALLASDEVLLDVKYSTSSIVKPRQ